MDSEKHLEKIRRKYYETAQRLVADGWHFTEFSAADAIWLMDEVERLQQGHEANVRAWRDYMQCDLDIQSATWEAVARWMASRSCAALGKRWGYWREHADRKDASDE